MSTHYFIETVMAWKYSKGLTDGLDYLAQHFDLHHVVENDVLYSKITTCDFYPTLLNLLHDRSFTATNDQSEGHKTQEIPTPPQCHPSSHQNMARRRTAYLAYQLLLTFQEPHIRERLSKTWREQDTENLIRNLIRRFSFHIGITEERPLIYTKNGSELKLSEDFEKALANASNFRRQVNILSLPQDPATYMGTESHAACATVQTAGNTITNPFPEPSSSLSHAYLLEGQSLIISLILYCPHACIARSGMGEMRGQACASLETTAAGAASTYAPVEVHDHIRGTSDQFADSFLDNTTIGGPPP
ncbi:hypothetical protein BDV30DRAFT_232987 [Aspergillus minisclerotigenes]|uniref:Uncharacterized protein n=1 Tax=Aspergillus minisclerotigenes TaxID=656917 RepID=A0A5N6JKB0_9EURO|nr:hypothetical protein BDV30DRAFT_232987 [Aspergillus minisclerotigenes]